MEGNIHLLSTDGRCEPQLQSIFTATPRPVLPGCYSLATFETKNEPSQKVKMRDKTIWRKEKKGGKELMKEK